MGTERIIDRALALGATSAGVVLFRDLRGAPRSDRLDSAWPDGAAALVVLTLSHPGSAPELDYWGVPGGTRGNHQMGEMVRQLVRWIEAEERISARPLAYHVERGGTLLKDAATLAGLGTIGANNLLITPDCGPRVRLRALALAREIEPTRRSDPSAPFDPCGGCPRYCQSACPQQAFFDGAYHRERCQRQMSADEARRGAASSGGPPLIRYCRECELACPVSPSR